FNDTATTEIYTLSLHDALPILIPLAAPDFWLLTPKSHRDFKGGALGEDSLRNNSADRSDALSEPRPSGSGCWRLNRLFPDRSLIRHRIASPYARSRLAWRRNAESEEKSTPRHGFSVPSVPSRRSLTTRSLRPKSHNSHQISGIADHEVAPCGIAESWKSPHKVLTSYAKMI